MLKRKAKTPNTTANLIWHEIPVHPQMWSVSSWAWAYWEVNWYIDYSLHLAPCCLYERPAGREQEPVRGWREDIGEAAMKQSVHSGPDWWTEAALAAFRLWQTVLAATNRGWWTQHKPGPSSPSWCWFRDAAPLHFKCSKSHMESLCRVAV